MKHYKTHKLRRQMISKILSGWWWNFFYIAGAWENNDDDLFIDLPIN